MELQNILNVKTIEDLKPWLQAYNRKYKKYGLSYIFLFDEDSNEELLFFKSCFDGDIDFVLQDTKNLEDLKITLMSSLAK